MLLCLCRVYTFVSAIVHMMDMCAGLLVKSDMRLQGAHASNEHFKTCVKHSTTKHSLLTAYDAYMIFVPISISNDSVSSRCFTISAGEHENCSRVLSANTYSHIARKKKNVDMLCLAGDCDCTVKCNHIPHVRFSARLDMRNAQYATAAARSRA